MGAQKLAYLIAPLESQSIASLNHSLLSELPSKIKLLGCEKFSINLFDEAVDTAAPLRIQNQQPAIAALVFVWVPCRSLFPSLQAAIESVASVLTAYTLASFEPIPAPSKHVRSNGHRTQGMMQLAFLKVPSELTKAEWLELWREQHTQVAIDTQSTFIYRKNVVQECLSKNDLGYSGIVEEAFPIEAMTSQRAFYAATSDEQLKERQMLMWKSCKRFIDLSDLDVLPTSEYCW